MAVKFVPAGNHYLIHVIELEQTLEGISLPDATKKDIEFGSVIAVGSTATEFKQGDQVLFGPWAGKNIAIEGTPFRVMKEEEIIGRLVNEP